MSKNSRSVSARYLGLLLGSCAFIATPVLAEDKGVQLEEVVVTAQKREQRLQDVPASVTAITADTLVSNRIQNVTDLTSVSPNLTVVSVPAGSTLPTYSLRGVVATGSAPGSDKGVALYIDGVYIGSASASVFDLAELERIEVLKGPQGTLFGRNSTGGAVSFTTRGPAGEFHLKQDVTFGDHNQFRTRTRLDTPQLGMLSAALTYTHSERRGDIRNLGAGTVWNLSKIGGPSAVVSPDWLGSQDSDSWAAAVKLDLTENFNLNYKFDHTSNDFTEAGVGVLQAPNPALGGPGAGALLSFFNASPNHSPVSTHRPDAVNNSATLPSHVQATGHVLIANWKVNDSLVLKNTLAYRTSEYSAPLNQLDGLGGLLAAPGVPYLGIVTSSAGADKQYSEELQVDYDSKLMHLTAGALYYHQKNSKGQYGTGFNSIQFTAEPGFVIKAPTVPNIQSSVAVTSWAVYAQDEIHIMDTLSAVAGARYTEDKKRGVDHTIPIVGNLDYDGSQWTYDAGLNYKPTSDILGYLKYSTGYISGGKLATLTYNPELAKSWEAGVKADWLKRRLRTNLSLFSVDYTNLQIAGSGSTYGVPAAAQVLVNAGDAKAKGFELETTLVPIRHLTFGASLGYLDFRYTRLDPLFIAAGNSLVAQRPKWTGNLSAQYVTEPVFDEARLNFRLDGNYQSAYSGGSNPKFRSVTDIDSSWTVNGRIALERINIAGANATFALWGKNLLDVDNATYTTALVVATAASFQPARSVGVDLTLEF
jgi:iron complex outermembrane receptor protein